MNTRAPNPRSQRGFTLIEILVASTVVGVALISGSWAMSMATSASAVFRNESITAPLVAREIHNLALTLPKAPSGSTGATLGSDVVALDSLIGAAFTPPLKADGSVDLALVGWTQLVDLDVYALADISTPAADDPADGLSPDDPKLYRLSVTVLQGGAEVDRFSWWIAP